MSDKTNTPKDTHYAKLRRAYRDEKSGGAPAFRARQPVPPGENAADGLVRLYGLHTVRAALDNPRRKIRKMLVTRNAAERLEIADLAALPFKTELVEPRDIDKITGSDAVHQGVLIEAEPLKAKRLDALGDAKLVLVLDQITDPHNVGAILRSAVAFGAGALITTARHSPQESGVLAKSASGALEHIDQIEVKNLADALGQLHEAGFRTIGLDSDAPAELEKSFAGEKIALVLGAEGKGLRQKTRETVTTLARLDMPGAIHSLNVSNAAAISLYVARKFLASSE
ncbi:MULTISPECIES: 23S rRNA (guanosine(2251)-2'-O)-methyltransferase RlmB [unclassified Mesorhizobium]|uniref:23S rRNA (guanosine(2251)-2'-O)-methyltransferase RlmB n=1 Tax=unclassified Mesorhizobium TaxID=325217 RepID=UPI000FD1B163|nr:MULTISPECIES: 23S rRNA (guanosine(2251)-2'-O)-methyltransferase RlmB [unclassified Mesorhizobium]AZV21798.1 23S rRNA (guanosine(2251)-2'-O)-methyltransferase RlmB [Mesorhizobium sp. M7A.F.Ce.TU.012.03.2.1]RUU87550.1 23S rRNA (guanosine(2251)-2'-O)-methyltransferase RlmB [Mesorhizobium sp. M7A.F.Ca.MR.176.00.0.0]RVD13759.1 23S rRNA (guanosine(2251)-2'-O)-methyltransferase RlmB [Mesorhizobium sp. M7A.F.Ca.ET.027.02.1.1]RWB05290.1 MAG: 23S rRNA (guanosine(2251)-2'-O)-methyltransferase RlmB [Mes